jgi:hypothetical protein
VCSDVLIQISQIPEVLTTILKNANECFVSLIILTVHFHMALEIASMVEAPATDIAYIHVLFEVSSKMTIQSIRV